MLLLRSNGQVSQVCQYWFNCLHSEVTDNVEVCAPGEMETVDGYLIPILIITGLKPGDNET